MGVLTIYLDRLENLADTDFIGETDPYVRLELEQDNWVRDVDYGYQVSSTKSNDLNPVYGETFYFSNIPSDLNNMVLTVKVMDSDFGTRDDKVGKCRIKLEDLGLSSRPMDIERNVDRKLLKKNGKVYLKLSYDT